MFWDQWGLFLLLESSTASKSKSNLKRFWPHVRSKLKTKEGIAPLLESKDKNSMKFSNEEKANILQRQFSGVFTKEPIGNVPLILPRSKENIQDIPITEDKGET